MRKDFSQITDEIVRLYQGLLIPFINVQRDLPSPANSSRAENDAEHAFTLAIVSISLSEKMNLQLDTGKLAKYALIHDLVEAYAGDVSAKADESEHNTKAEKEQEALKKIKQNFGKSVPWIHEAIENYESQADKEAIFVYLVDKNMGVITWFAAEGKGWAKYYPEEDGSGYKNVVKRLREKVQKTGDKEMLAYFDYLHDLLDEKRHEYFKKSIY